MKKYNLISAVLLLFSCGPKEINAGNGIHFKVHKEIEYGKAKRQKLDLYLPETTEKSKYTFILLHGGGWRGGDKKMMNSFIRNMMKEFPNSVFANINYRLAGSGYYAIPNQTYDIQTAIYFLSKYKERKVDGKIVLIGVSSGAHTSMIYGYHFDPDKAIHAVVNIVGPSKLNDPGFENYPDYPFVKQYLLDPKIIPESNSPVQFASPVHWISSAIPTISFYAKNDNVVPLSQKSALDSAFATTKIKNESYLLSGGHKDWDEEENKRIMVSKLSEFLKTYEKN